MAAKVTAPKIRAMKAQGERVVCITAYDASFARIADEAGVDLVLVGDSLGNVLLGYRDTLPVSLEEMLHHTRAASRGVERALLVADLPFGSYQASAEDAVRASVQLVKAGAQAVKLEGVYDEAIRGIVRAGIPVMGHLGMTPQSVHQFGGFRVQGRGEAGAAIIDGARRLEEAGVFSAVLELVPAALACEVTKQVEYPTIGIGAGAGCDGQVQVLHDVLGLSGEVLRHAKAYADLRGAAAVAISQYAKDVREGEFPQDEHAF